MIRKRYYIKLLILVALMGVLISLLLNCRFGQNTFFVPLGLGLSIIILFILIFRHIKNLENTFSSFLEHLKTEQYGFQSPPGFNKWMTPVSKAEIQAVINQFKDQSLLQEGRAQLTQSIIDQIPVAVIGLNPHNQIVFANHAIRHLLGLDKPPTFELIASKWKPLARFIIEEKTNSVILPWEANSGLRQFAIEQATIKQPKRVLKLITLYDISKELTEKELASWQQLLRTLTHEINNTLTPILSLVEATHESYLPNLTTGTDVEKQRKAYHHIEESMQMIAERGKNLKRFINNYRKITPKHPVHKEEINLQELAYKLRILFSSQLQETGIRWKQDLAEKINTIHADRSYLEQVLINLIKNAIESIKEPEGEISLSSAINGDEQVVLMISDTGVGISKENRAQIFTPFFTTKSNGSGIGLTLCKQIMHLHGGVISIASEPGKGTTVTLVFNK